MQRAFKGFALRKKHGGETRIGKRKEARPIATKRAMHLTLRSSKAKGKLSLFTKKKEIQAILFSFAKKFQVKIYEFSNNGNHLHLLTKASTRGGFKRFLSAVSGRIAQLMTKAIKGKPLEERFWDFLPFTRIVEGGADFFITRNYVEMNWLEAAGIIPFQLRKGRRRRPPE